MNKFISKFLSLTALLALFCAFLLPLAAFNANAASGDIVRVDNTSVRLIADHTVVTPGQTFTVGWELVPDQGWHVYAENPGDTGLPSELTWQLPVGFNVGQMQWPTPEKFITEPLVSYGYSHPTILLVDITVPQDIPTGQAVNLIANAAFLMCADVCLPAETELAFSISIGDTPQLDQQTGHLFAQARAKLPLDGNFMQPQVSLVEQTYILTFTSAETVNSVSFIPAQEDWINDFAPQVLTNEGEGRYSLTINIDKYSKQHPENLSGILLINGQGFTINPTVAKVNVAMVVTSKASSFTISPASLTAVQPTPIITAPTIEKVEPQNSLKMALFFAFIAGLILNLMPCVLPVLGLKVMGVLRHAHGGHESIHSLAFGVGVISTFWLLAAILVTLQHAGSAIGWGFQLQEPAFIVSLIILLTFMALIFLGMVDISAPFNRIANSLGTNGGLLGSFLSGTLVTVLATPCTVPFMGTAVAYALGQSSIIIMAVFTSLGFGLALPYMLLTLIPAWLKFVPKPGPWMVTLQQFLAFPLFATVAWLLWVLGRQTSMEVVLVTLSGCLLIAFGSWLYGRMHGVAVTSTRRLLAEIMLLTTLIIAAVTSYSYLHRSNVESADLQWNQWTTEAVNTAISAGKPVFINFTADWCITCKVNEKIAFNSNQVQNALYHAGVELFIADWTKKDAAIAAELARHNRSGVPLYLYYPANSDQPQILPQLLTPSYMLKLFSN